MEVRRRLAILAVLPLAVLAGCGIGPHDRDVHAYGTLTLGWTLAGRQDAAACIAYEASFVRVVLRDDLDGIVLDELVACSAFTSRYLIHRGWYAAVLTLLDASAAAVSSPEPTGTFYVTQGRESAIAVRFAAPVTSGPDASPAPPE